MKVTILLPKPITPKLSIIFGLFFWLKNRQSTWILIDDWKIDRKWYGR